MPPARTDPVARKAARTSATQAPPQRAGAGTLGTTDAKVDHMTAPEPHASPTAPRDRDWKWDGTDKLDRVLDHDGWQSVANAHAWYDDEADDNDPPHKKTAYKMPHHELIDGEPEVFGRACTEP